jgi:archaellum biogenesis ATPase FlaH
MTEYTLQIQKLFLEMMIADAQSFVRVQNIFNVKNFHPSLQPAADFMEKHSTKYGTLPELSQLLAMTEIRLLPLPEEINDGHYDWFMEEFESFTKRQELERAILKSADLLEKGDFAPVEKLIKDAVQISLTKDMGTDYFEDPKARLLAIKNNNGQASTGWPTMDYKLYGGFNRGELQIFAGGSGSGKSLFMQNLAVNWAGMNLNGVFITLELSEDLCAMRIDSMMTDTASNAIFKNIDDVEMKVKIKAKVSGNLQIKYFPAQSNINDIRSYVKELQVKTGKKIDFMCIDYLDLLMPVSAKVSPSDLFVKDKYVSEEIRNLGKELDVLMVTASQLNRSAVEEQEFDHSMISGGISKINTADNVFGIFTSRAMRERGKYQLQLMKTRSSAGVGQKIDLEFDVDTLRIFDLGPQANPPGSQSSLSILDGIKAKSTVTPGVATGAVDGEDPVLVRGDVQSAKLNLLLNKIKS